MTIDTVGGVFSYATTLCETLTRRGLEFVLVSMGPPASDEQRGRLAGMHGVSFVETDYRLEWMNDPWAEVEQAGTMLLELERSCKPDLVHLNGYVHGCLPFSAPTLVAAHSCVLSWWQAVKDEPAPPRYASYRERVRRGLLGADMVVTPTHAMRDLLVQEYGRLPLVRVLANGCDLNAFGPCTKEPIIAAAGRVWDEAKNLATLLRVADELPWPVTIAGDCATPTDPDAACAVSGPRCVGRLSQSRLAQLLARSAIYVAPARYEPFGLSNLEAAASGCALVLGDIPSLRELWSEAALFVPPNDDSALSSAIRKLIDDESLRGRLARCALQRSARYSQTSFGETYLALYRTMLRHPRPLTANLYT